MIYTHYIPAWITNKDGRVRLERLPQRVPIRNLWALEEGTTQGTASTVDTELRSFPIFELHIPHHLNQPGNL